MIIFISGTTFDLIAKDRRLGPPNQIQHQIPTNSDDNYTTIERLNESIEILKESKKVNLFDHF